MQTPPLIWPSVATPAGDVPNIKDLYAHLMGIAYNVEAWDAALQLYELSKQTPSGFKRDVVHRWRFIASSECVMQLHHLKERLQRIKSVKLRDCESIKNNVDASLLREATKSYAEYFPHIDELRHAVAHAAEIDCVPEKHAPDGQYGLVGFREPDRFSAPYKGKLRHLDLTKTTLNRINKIVAGVFDAFVPAARELERQGHLE
jgi:hypothetical protein